MTETHPIPTIVELRRSLTVDNWPSGRDHTTAEFRIYRSPQSLGERAERRTLKADGSWSAWKRLTYCRIARIAVDDTGRTWCIGLTPRNQVVVTPGTMGPACHYYDGAAEGRTLANLLRDAVVSEVGQ